MHGPPVAEGRTANRESRVSEQQRDSSLLEGEHYIIEHLVCAHTTAPILREHTTGSPDTTAVTMSGLTSAFGGIYKYANALELHRIWTGQDG